MFFPRDGLLCSTCMDSRSRCILLPIPSLADFSQVHCRVIRHSPFFPATLTLKAAKECCHRFSQA